MSNPQKSTATKPKHINDIPQWDIETDVAIVGYGGAGSCAAIEASDAGSEVCIFEVASESGGSTKLSSGEIYMGGNGGTPIQKACGFEDSTEDMVTYLMNSVGPQADEAKVRTYCENSTEHFDWLTRMGAKYKESFHKERAIVALTDDCLLYTGSEKAWPFNEQAKPCPRGHNLLVEGDNGGPMLMGILDEQIQQRDIRVEFEARALTLITDDEGTVCGLVVRMNMQETYVKANKGVILCAGGFVMNDDMLQKYAPQLLRATYKVGNPGDTGTGIMMGMGAGGAVVNMSEGFVTMPFYPPADITHGILINQQAQRFINEDCYHGRVGSHVMQQVGERCYFILHASEDFKPPTFLFADIAGTGETIEELAEEINLPAAMLKNTIDFYNDNAKNGNDPLFHKGAEYLQEIKAPYAALDCTPGRGAFFPYFTLGGLNTLPTGEVLDAGDNIIKGLFAAGRTTAGVPRSGKGYSSGMSVGDATFFGRLAGKTAAQTH